MSKPAAHRPLAGLLCLSVLLAACGAGSGASPVAPSAAASTQPASSDPLITLSAPASAAPGAAFKVGWTGAETSGDFFVIVPAGATTWTEGPDSPYINATMGNPLTLTAPKSAGSYEIWFMKGDTEGPLIIKARSPLKVG